MPHLSSVKVVYTALPASSSTQFIKALKFTFSNGDTTEDIVFYPSSYSASITQALADAQATTIDEKVSTFSSDLITNEDLSDQISNLHLHKIRINDKDLAVAPTFDTASTYDVENAFEDIVGVDEFLCGFRTVMDSDYIYTIRPVICFL